MVRQGDVLVERINAIPPKLKKQKPENGRVILAHGEVTGHHHSIDADAADWWKEADAKPDADQFVHVKKPTRVVHQEHTAIDLAPGSYRITRQREYSPAGLRKVQD